MNSPNVGLAGQLPLDCMMLASATADHSNNMLKARLGALTGGKLVGGDRAKCPSRAPLSTLSTLSTPGHRSLP